MKLACTPGPLHLSLTSSAHNRQAFLLLFSLGEKKSTFWRMLHVVWKYVPFVAKNRAQPIHLHGPSWCSGL